MLKRHFILCIFMVAALTAVGPGLGPRTHTAAARTDQMPVDGVQVLASGPIHEAFAEAVALDPEPGIEAPSQPPARIEEIPPSQKPAGAVQWIPGYWAWDDESNEYIWVSGIWRVPPPGRQWVSGYWSPVRYGYQWISGYWARAAENETAYLPEPPESMEAGPSSRAPSSEHSWIPGCWRWMDGRYAWRPGYWDVVHPNWVWVPSYYNWTPHGYIFVGGYWDYPVIHRGILFAPVFFPPRVHLGLAFSFSPGMMINLSIFDDALFLRPRYRHYYYGDYYAPRHYRRGIYPWFSLHARRAVYDPIYAHQRWHHRHDRHWRRHLEAGFQKRRAHKASRPHPLLAQRSGPARAVRAIGSKRSVPVHRRDGAAERRRSGSHLGPDREKKRGALTQRSEPVRTYRMKPQRRDTRRQPTPAAKLSRQPLAHQNKSSGSAMIGRPNPKAGGRKGQRAQVREVVPKRDRAPLVQRSGRARALTTAQKRADRWQGATVKRPQQTRALQKPAKAGGWQQSGRPQQRVAGGLGRWNGR